VARFNLLDGKIYRGDLDAVQELVELGIPRSLE
jgi:hypothetical protein